LSEDVFPSVKITDRKMPGKGNGHTKLLTFENAIELVMVLPGKVAKETRTQFANIIRRYLAGDHTLIKEIQANAQSALPIAQMARKSLGITTEEDLNRKRRREDLEIESLQLEIEDRKQKLQLEIEDRKRQSALFHINGMRESVVSHMSVMDSLDPNWKKNGVLVMKLKDLLTNITMGQQLIKNGDDKPILITMVAKELGYPILSHGQECKIGKELAKLYRLRYNNADPEQCERIVHGMTTDVNYYTKRDQDIMEQAIHTVLKK